MEFIQPFSTTIAVVDNIITKQQGEDIVDYIKNQNALLKHGSILGIGKSTWNESRNDIDLITKNVKYCKNFKAKIEDYVNDYAAYIGLKPQVLGNSWVNIQGKGSTLNKHSHPYTHISAALYLKADNYSEGLTFYTSDRNHPEFVDLNTGKYYVEAIVGRMILFPSWLMHGMENKNESEERAVLSFNTYLCQS